MADEYDAPMRLDADGLLRAPFPRAMLYGTADEKVPNGARSFELSVPLFAVANTAQLWAAVREHAGAADGDVVGFEVGTASLEYLPKRGVIGCVVGRPLDISAWLLLQHPEAGAVRVTTKAQREARQSEQGGGDLIDLLRAMAAARGGDE